MNILIRGGTVIDPANSINSQQDVYISDGKIVAGTEGFKADEIIDASGTWGTPDSNVPEQKDNYPSEPSTVNGSMNNNNASLSSGGTPAGTAAGTQGENTAL